MGQALFSVVNNRLNTVIECVRSCDQTSYLHIETKGGICIKIAFNAQKNISLLQHGRRFFVYSSNMAAVTSSEHTLHICDLEQTSMFGQMLSHDITTNGVTYILILSIIPFL